MRILLQTPCWSTEMHEDPKKMSFTELMLVWSELEHRRGWTREEADRHWEVESELNLRVPPRSENG